MLKCCLDFRGMKKKNEINFQISAQKISNSRFSLVARKIRRRKFGET